MIETTYLTVDKLKDFTPIVASVDTTLLENWIPVAETMHIVPVLGDALDSALKTELETYGTLTGNNATLLTYILNASAWYCFLEASSFIRTKFTNKSATQQFSENSQVIEKEDFKSLRQEILDKAMFFRNKLIDYLENNKSKFPLYRSDNDCDNIGSKEYSAGIWL